MRAWRQGRTAVLAVANPGAVAATVSVGIVRAGATERPPDMQDVAVGPGQRVEFSLTNALGPNEGAVVVDATEPVVVNRALYSDGRHHPVRSDRGRPVTARIVLAAVLVVVAALVAWVLDRRTKAGPPAQGRSLVPLQVDRARLPAGRRRRGSSCCGRRARANRAADCSTRCAPLASDDVAVVEVEYQSRSRPPPALPDRSRADDDRRRRGRRDARVVRRRVHRHRPLGRARRTARLSRGLRGRPRSARSRTPRCRRRG